MATQPDLRVACGEMFRLIRIEGPDTVRLGEIVCPRIAEPLASWLQGQIYKTFFCAMAPSGALDSPAPLLRALSLANAGGGGWRKESLTGQPGAYLAYGAPEPPGTQWLRFYWNVTPRGAILLTARATSVLNRLLVPFRLKVQFDTSLRRRDAAVLYLPRGLWEHARAVMEPLSRELEASGDVCPDTPLFTRPLRPGIALAEDPQAGLSFGMHRSGLAARALVRGYDLGHAGEEALWLDLAAEFRAEGLSLERPYLNAGSTDVYRL
ncbi:MAG TPA: T3SS effector HopA1 family protein [Bryobacteraceae bacterium]|nr:T3SS effector HopA1 family protein [Bryobacteraceae bacterium]